ncbi:5770_t:CDS:2 [Entrophospora sp. SA101]|nr:5770_t:CDS:2 [Entrophospora sp. SA101]
MNLIASFIISILLGLHGYTKKSLSLSGAIAAFFVGLGTIAHDWNVYAVVLLTFYFTSSRLTKYKAERKKKLEEDYVDGGQRTIAQVLCTSLFGTSIAILHQWIYGGNLECLLEDRGSRFLFWMYIGHYATCNGDTWASELGILSKDWPILITTFKKVPPGTNGGVSPLGLLASVMGGFIIGVFALITIVITDGCVKIWYEIIIISSFAGFFGSLVDSLLGATVQQTNYSEKSKKITYHETENVKVISGIDLLDNNQVNFFSALFTVSGLTAISPGDLEEPNLGSFS